MRATVILNSNSHESDILCPDKRVFNFVVLTSDFTGFYFVNVLLNPGQIRFYVRV